MTLKFKLPRVGFMWLRENWRTTVITLSLLLIPVFILSPQPKVIEGNLNIYEAQTILKLQEPDKPWYRAVNAVYLLPVQLISQINNNYLDAARLVSSIFVLLATVLFYFLVKAWFNRRIALVGSVIFLTNSLVLNFAHQATSWSAIILSLVAVFASLNWFLRTKNNVQASFFSFIAVIALSAYLPYGLYFILVGMIGLIIYGRKNLKKLKPTQLILALIIYLTILAPLFVSLAGAPGQLKELLGVPQQITSIQGYGRNLILILSSLFVYAKSEPVLMVGNLPVLDIFTAALVALGIYYFIKRIRHRRSLLLFSSSILLILILSLNDRFMLFIGILLPIIYAFAIAGLIELMKRWFSYFPRNPLARNFGVAMLVIAISLTSFYQMERYYVAWAQSPETRAVYMIEYNQ